MSHKSFAFEFDFTFNAPQAVREPDDDSVTYADQSSGDLVMAVGPVTSPLQSQGTNIWEDVIPSPEMKVEHSCIRRVLQNEDLPRTSLPLNLLELVVCRYTA